MPPAPGRRVHGEEAKAEARRLLRLAQVYGLNPQLKAYLCGVAKGERPLNYLRWSQITRWYASQEPIYKALGIPLTAAGHREYVRRKRLAPNQPDSLAPRTMRVQLPGT